MAKLQSCAITAQVWLLTGPARRFVLKESTLPHMSRTAATLDRAVAYAVALMQPIHADNGETWVKHNDQGYMLFPWYPQFNRSSAPAILAMALARLHQSRFAAAMEDHFTVRTVMAGVDADHLPQEASMFCDATVVATASTLVKNEISRREQWFDMRIQHGDLHPHNLYHAPNGSAVLHDGEFMHFGPQLYDVAFWTGCNGFEDYGRLDSPATLEFLRTYAIAAQVRSLDCETFFPMVLAARLHWLHRWIHDADSLAVRQECAFLTSLIHNREPLEQCWHAALEKGLAVNSEKWLVQDAVVSKPVAALHNKLKVQYPQTLKQVLEAIEEPPEKAAEMLRFLTIAWGKEGNFSSIVDTVHWQESLCKSNNFAANREECAYTYANASLDCARNRQVAAMRLLIDKSQTLAQRYPGESQLTVAAVFVLRNYSVLLAEQHRYSQSMAIIAKIGKLYELHSGSIAIAEEFARALSSGVIAALRTGATRMQVRYRETLEKLADRYPKSAKIHGARTIALKNLADRPAGTP